MNIRIQGNNGLSIMHLPVYGSRGLKSTEQKQQRQAECNNQIAFYEKQKENLKSVTCDTVEEIARKLDMYHSYEDEIAAAKMAYNNEEMFHILDEAEEMGEKIAKYAEKTEPKTPEERKEEAAEELREEAVGTEESEGILSELLEASEAALEELQETSEAALEELQETSEAALEELQETSEAALEELQEAPETGLEKQQEMLKAAQENRQEQFAEDYRPLDIRI